MVSLIPESKSAPEAVRRRYNRRTSLAGPVFAAGLAGAVFLSGGDGPVAWVIVSFAVTLLALVVIVYEFVRLMRALDELQSRIHTTALAAGMGAGAVFATMTGLAGAVFTGGGTLWAGLGVLALPVGLVGYYIGLHVGQRLYR